MKFQCIFLQIDYEMISGKIVLTTISLLLALQSSGQVVQEQSGSIVWDLGPEHPRIDLAYGTKGINSAGYEDTAPVITNNYPDVLLVKVEFELIDFCGESQTYTVTAELSWREKYAPNPFMDGFQFDTPCAETKTYGSAKKFKTGIQRVGYNVVTLRNLTEEKQKAAEAKAQKEIELAQQREAEKKEASEKASVIEAEQTSAGQAATNDAANNSTGAVNNADKPAYGRGDDGKYYQKQSDGRYQEISYNEYLALKNNDHRKGDAETVQKGPTVEEINAQLAQQRKDYEETTASENEAIGEVTDLATGLVGDLMQDAARRRYAEISAYVKYSEAAKNGDVDAMAWMAQWEANNKDPKRANEWLVKAANGGNVWAIETVIRCLKKGSPKYRIAQDKYEAKNWEAKLRGEETPVSKYNRAYSYYKNKDYSAAFVLFKALADEGDSDAQNHVGYMYSNGYGTERDLTKATEYFDRSAKGGCVNGMSNLADAYWKGEGVEQDGRLAVKWFNKAADEGLNQALNSLGVVYLMGEAIEKDTARAMHYLKLAVEKNVPDAMITLSTIYQGHYNFPPDPAKAAHWLKRAAALNSPLAYHALGRLYSDGIHFPKDIKAATAYFQKASDSGLLASTISIAIVYYNEGDHTSALPILRKVSESSDGEFEYQAMYILGLMYYNGEAVERDYATAVEWWKKSADGGYITAMTDLADCYEEGTGIAKDQAEAKRWREKAEAAGGK